MKGIDCTAAITPALAKALKSNGIDFVCRYLVPIKYAWKRLTPTEAKVITGAGLKLLTIFESNANEALKDSGTADGKTAFAEAKIVGQPTGTTIYFAVDFDAQVKDFPTILAYFQAAQKEIPGYSIGVYGSYPVCEYLYSKGITHLWQTYAWSHSKVSARANVYQYKNGQKVSGIVCDLNESFGNEGFWNGDSERSIMTDWNKNAVDFVTAFQKKFGLTADGKAGTNTLAKLDDIVAQINKLMADNTAHANKINQIKTIIGG